MKPDQQTSLQYNMTLNIDHACYLEGNRHESGHSIPRSHPCHYCSCVRGYIDCYWQKFPPSPIGCIELNYDGVCNPSLYLCPIPEHNQTFPVKYTLRRDGQKYKTEEEPNEMKNQDFLWFFIFTSALLHPSICVPVTSINSKKRNSTIQYDFQNSKENSERKGNLIEDEKPCLFDGTPFVHGQHIPRSDPCETCRCDFGNVFCWKNSCNNTNPNAECEAIHVEGICCVVYECPEPVSIELINENTTQNVSLDGRTSIVTRTTDPFTETILSSTSTANLTTVSPGTPSEPSTCRVNEEEFTEGALIPFSSGPCIECRCGKHGQIDCKRRACEKHDLVVRDNVR
ncbi:kielin/chordin-like protein [Tachypleus tridentatus]|uniref:kielin/chordin-like protein n=1 Tax=Tachypleus tridentatus TaxID=6853 RepID=UPI003FD19E51